MQGDEEEQGRREQRCDLFVYFRGSFAHSRPFSALLLALRQHTAMPLTPVDEDDALSRPVFTGASR
jgi:hypothetical protein